MKASELVTLLQAAIDRDGDLDVIIEGDFTTEPKGVLLRNCRPPAFEIETYNWRELHPR